MLGCPPPRGCSFKLVGAEAPLQPAVSSVFCSEILTHPNLKVRMKLTAAGGETRNTKALVGGARGGGGLSPSPAAEGSGEAAKG